MQRRAEPIPEALGPVRLGIEQPPLGEHLVWRLYRSQPNGRSPYVRVVERPATEFTYDDDGWRHADHSHAELRVWLPLGWYEFEVSGDHSGETEYRVEIEWQD